MIELLYVATGMLVGGLAVELTKGQGRRALEETKRELGSKLEAMQAAMRRLEQPGVNRVAVSARPQHGEEVERMGRESLEGLHRILADTQGLVGMQRAVGHKLGELQMAVARLEGRSDEAATRPPGTACYEPAPTASVRPAQPSPEHAAAPDLSARMAQLWNDLPWPSHSDEGIRRLGAELGLQIAGPFKSRYWLLYGGGGDPLFLLPALGKDVSLFGDGFFEMPKRGNAHQLRSPALVQLRPGARLQDELARLRDPDSGLTLNQVFPDVRGGHVE
jgi:hypothetical protein